MGSRNSAKRINAALLRPKDDATIIHSAEAIVKKFLVPGAEQEIDFGNADMDELKASVADEANKAIAAGDSEALQKFIFVEIQNAAIIAMENENLHEDFKMHSEYKRYLFKFKRVYNFISHWDFDFMQTLGKGWLSKYCTWSHSL